MTRRTKIIATIGPASDNESVLRGMIEAGTDVVRIGLAHGSLADGVERLRHVRRIAAGLDKDVGVLVDLPGPKVRLGHVPNGGLELETGAVVRLTPGRDNCSSSDLGVDYESLTTDMQPGDTLAIGDGTISLRVESVQNDALKASVTYGGRIQGRPGLHIPSDRLTLATPTAEDIYQLDAFVEAGVDMVALSFVRSAHDVRRIGTEPHPRGPLVVAKIETRAAVNNLEGIVESSGAIMVARGDLGIEMGIEELPHLQKRITAACIALGRPVITATQMLESMIGAGSPTRAEVTDVANAIFDGSSAVMLSAETAIGSDPVAAVAAMARISARADTEFDDELWARRLSTLRKSVVGTGDDRITDAMTGAAWRAATEMGASAIICISDSGFTVRSIARYRPRMPILGYSPSERTVRQLSLSWGVTPLRSPTNSDHLSMVNDLVADACGRGLVRSGDLVAVLAGAGGGSRAQATDMLRLVEVP